jgi:phage regulator Rha-like protein
MKLQVTKTMSSVEIAKLTGKQHKDVMRDIRVIDEQMTGANLRWLIKLTEYKAGNGQMQPCYQLDYESTIIVLTGYDVVARVKVVKRWQELELKQIEKESQAKIRSELRLEFRPMTDAIVESREGKETKPHHFSNEADLLNRIVLGCTAAQYRRKFEIEDDVPLRDILSKEQTRCISDLQRANTVYLLEGASFEERKARLKSLFSKRYEKKLFLEIEREA